MAFKNHIAEDPDKKDTGELLDNRWDPCEAWSQFFSDLCAVQGISTDVHTTLVAPMKPLDLNTARIATSKKDVDDEPGHTTVNNIEGYWAFGKYEPKGNTYIPDGGSHAFCMYNNNVYDASFGFKQQNTSWSDYFKGLFNYFGFLDPSKPEFTEWLTFQQAMQANKRISVVYKVNQKVKMKVVWKK